MARRSRKAAKITTPEPPANLHIRFSFEFYDTDQTTYCLSGWTDTQIRKALACLKDINAKSFNELQQNGAVYHFHPVDWSKTTEKNGFGDQRLTELTPFQFSLLGVNSQKARVFGAWDGKVFYIVWFDLYHRIWPSFKKHT